MQCLMTYPVDYRYLTWQIMLFYICQKIRLILNFSQDQTIPLHYIV